MDIGSAKPNQQERDEVPHHLLDLVGAEESFSVGKYQDALEATLKTLHAEDKLPIIDCGTPMYLQAFLSGILDAPDPDPDLRQELESRPNQQLMDDLRQRDPAAAERLHLNDRKRLVRALEYAIQTGEAISGRQRHFDRVRDDYRIILTGPLWAGETLRPRINLRIQRMLDAGLVAEVERIQKGEGFSQSAAAAIGYRQILDYLDGKLSLEEAIEKIQNRTWNLARKQLMWFKRHQAMKWIHVADEAELRRAAVFLSGEVLDAWRPDDHGLPLGLERP
ncbi:MAG: tRNA (adenosine(37)-N6)-dimethylallyltransferase MiaA, partial [Planctomycetes bacterium]|nr:tRNA (adenosine(37)-N6)-dimethylallyltransferase MiaA [Planctomycetota bacterium]